MCAAQILHIILLSGASVTVRITGYTLMEMKGFPSSMIIVEMTYTDLVLLLLLSVALIHTT